MAQAPVPVTILTGFLGAGKTTLLARLLSRPEGVRFGVLVNDFGAINIDAALIVEAGVDQVALANGCVCCSIRDDLIGVALRLLERAPPDRIIVETSGVSRPLAVADALESPPLGDRLAVDGIFCLVDADRFQTMDFADTELALDQALGSDLVLLNKCDLADDRTISAVETTLRGPMPALRILRTSFADVPRSLLLGPDHQHRVASDGHHHHDDHAHADAFASWSWRSAEPLDLIRFRAAMRSIPPDVLRAKGILAFAGRPGERAVFQLVGKRKALSLEPGAPPAESTLVAIARAGALDPAALTALFDGCRA